MPAVTQLVVCVRGEVYLESVMSIPFAIEDLGKFRASMKKLCKRDLISGRTGTEELCLWK